LDIFKWRILVYFLFFSDGGAPKRRAAWGNLSPYPFLNLDRPG